MPDSTPPIDRIKRQIVQRLSLRKPQEESLDLLVNILARIELSKDASVIKQLEEVKDAYPNLTDFERDFPSICFALATGVGKTRLMGAFIAYLFLTGRSKHFLVLAPNTTIYEKLISDFTQGSGKYVFRGITEFTHNPPVIVTGDNWDNGRGVQGSDLFDSPIINIFNVDKINKDKGRIRKMQEVIGQSYFDYLGELPDLVMLMDEAHRYRAKAGMTAIAELKPVLGLEVTATPKTVGANPKDFKNVIYHYPLGNAMNDGFVKEPAVATRADFRPRDVNEEQLQRIKLEDGIHCHENTRTELAVYANNNGLEVVKPFMLIVAQDTTHSRELLEQIQSDDFFDGRYKDKVIEINSAQRGEESEEATTKLLELEHTDETEIVIHVNKLKEGWDVTNLYTIVPLRASASEILTEQTLGRGLRLPYGKRTGNDIVDRLTVVAHDRYDAVIEQAKDPNSVVQMKSVIVGGKDGVPTETSRVIEVKPTFLAGVTGETVTVSGVAEAGSEYTAKPPTEPIFKTVEDQKVASTTLEIIQQQFERKCKNGLSDLQNEEMKSQIAQSVKEAISSQQGTLEGVVDQPNVDDIVNVLVDKVVEHTIEIPEIVIIPTSDVSFGFNDFDLASLSSINYQPISDQIKITEIRTQHQQALSRAMGVATEDRLEDYILKHLVDKDIIDYESQAELLYKLSGQAVNRVKDYLSDPLDRENVCLCHGKKIADFIFDQMMMHYFETPTGYRADVTRGFTSLRPQNFGSSKDKPVDFRIAVSPLSDTKKYVFGGFGKCCFHFQRFDSDPERQLAVLLDSAPETSVLRWMKPADNQFQIEYETGRRYNPDFVVETDTEILIIEVKARNELSDTNVLSKARAARRWVYYANQVAKESDKKEWLYLLVPHDEIKPSSTLAGIKAGWTQPEFDED